MKLKNKVSFWNVVLIVLFVVLGIFILYPFLALVVRSFQGEAGTLSLENYKMFFSKAYYYKTLFNGLKIAVVCTILSVMIGLPLAYISSRFNIWGKKILEIMIVMSLLSPPFIGAYSWILLLGRNGFITKLFEGIGITFPTIYGFGGIVLVFTLKLFPFVYMYTSRALKNVDSSLEEAAENLGVFGLKKLLTVTFPLILPTIMASALMVFMTSLADFGTPLLIGEGYKVLPVVIYEEYMSEMGGNASFASALSVIMITVSLLILWIQEQVVSRKSYTMSGLRPPQVVNLSKGKRFLATLFAFVVAFLAILPQLTVIITSFIKTNGPMFVKGFSLDSYKNIVFKLSTSIKNTFLFSSIAIVFMLLIGVFISYLSVRRKSKATRLLDMISMAPYVIPGAVLGITLSSAFNHKPLLLTGTAVILIVSYTIRKLPYTLRSSVGILYQIDGSVEEASINLGVGPLKTFYKITLRLMLSGVISGAILSWISTINELSSTMILYTGRTATISVSIYSEILNSGFGTAAALATILTLATVVSLAIFRKISGGADVV